MTVNPTQITVRELRADFSRYMLDAAGGTPIQAGDGKAALVSIAALKCLSYNAGMMGEGAALDPDSDTPPAVTYAVIGFVMLGDIESASSVIARYYLKRRDMGGDESLVEVLDHIRTRARHFHVAPEFELPSPWWEERMDDVARWVRAGYPGLERDSEHPIEEADLPPADTHEASVLEFASNGLRRMISRLVYTDGIRWTKQTLAAFVGGELGLLENSSGVVYSPSGEQIASSRTELADAMVQLEWIVPGELGARQIWGNLYRDNSGSVPKLINALESLRTKIE